MTGRGQPFPSGRSGNFVRVQFADAPDKIARARWHEAREKRDRAADRWVGWGIIRFASQVRHLESMSVNRDVPVLRQGKRGPGVIEMAMRQNNRFRSGARAEPRFGRYDDLVRPARQPRVHQHPWTARPPNKIDVHETDREPADIRRDASDGSHGDEDDVTSLQFVNWRVKSRDSAGKFSSVAAFPWDARQNKRCLPFLAPPARRRLQKKRSRNRQRHPRLQSRRIVDDVLIRVPNFFPASRRFVKLSGDRSERVAFPHYVGPRRGPRFLVGCFCFGLWFIG